MKNRKKLLFLACALALQGCGDPENRSEEYLTSAKSFYEQENYDKAKLELKNALQINDKSAEAYYYLALVSEKEERWKEVYNALQQAVKFDPTNKDARLKLTRLYIMSGYLDQAKIEVDFLLAEGSNDSDVIALHGVLLLKNGETDAALVEANKALLLNPSHIESVGLVIGAYLEQQDYKAAETKINNALVESPDEVEFYLLKLQIYMESKDPVLIEKTYQTMIAKFPERHDLSYALAQFYVFRKRDSDALGLLENVVEKNPSLLKPKLILVDYLLQKDIKSAEGRLNEFIKTHPGESDLYFKLANLYILDKRFEEARVPLNWVVEHNGNSEKGMKAKTTLAKFAVQDGDKDKALGMINEVLAIDSRNYDALILKARMSLADGSQDDAIVELRSISRDYSKSDEALVLLGQAFAMKGSPELAEENFRKALDLNPANFSALMPVVTRMIKSNDMARAEERLKTALKSQPNHQGALQALAQIRLVKKDWTGSQKIADMMEKSPQGENGKGMSHYLKGQISQGQGAFEKAIEEYEIALSDIPGLAGALDRMAQSYEKLEKRDVMHVYLDEFIAKNPKLYFAVLLKSQLFSMDEDWDKSIVMLNKGIAQWPKAPIFYETLAAIHLNNNEKGKAVMAYQSGLEKTSGDEKLGGLLAAMYEKDKDYDNAVKVYESVIAKNPKADVITNNLVSLLLDHYSGKEHIDKAVRLSKRFSSSDNAYFLDTYGWSLFKSGDVKESVLVLEQSVSKSPKVAVFKYHLGEAYYAFENYTDAVRLLEGALKLGKEKPGSFAEREKTVALLKLIKSQAIEL